MRVPLNLAAKPLVKEERTWAVDCPACAQLGFEFGLGRLRVHWSDALRVADWHNRVVHGMTCLSSDEPPLA